MQTISSAALRLLFSAVLLPLGVMASHAQENDAKPRTALIYDEIFLRHDTGPGFPESPERLRLLTKHLRENPIGGRLLWTEPGGKTDPLPWILEMHEADYVAELKRACQVGARLGADNPISEQTYEVAVKAVAGALTAVDLVMEGRVTNAFAALRPPGHHAMPDRAKGFCFFGNAAIAARYAQKHHKLERVMIVDWDVHHGDGTQEMFLKDPTVFFFSTHQYPFYPGPSGAAEITGEGEGKGFNMNVPLAAGGGDEAVLKVFRTQLTDAFQKFKPQLLIISAGFDAHEADPLGALGWSNDVYAELTEILRALCREQGHERIVSLLEGGYSERGITEGVRRHIEALEAGAEKTVNQPMPADYHTHTPLCKHATGAPEEYVEAAIAAGLDEYGISDHAPCRPEPFDDWRMLESELPEYFDWIDRAKKTAGDRVKIRAGMECDWIKGCEGFIEELSGKYAWDYLIGSVHYLGDWDFDNPKWLGKWAETDVDAVWTQYWKTYADMAESGLFDILAHPDLVKKFSFAPEGDLDRFYDPVIEAIAANGSVIELNTAGWHKPCAEAYPAPRFLELAASAGIGLVISSDAHAPAEVARDFPKARALAKAAGFRETQLFDKRRRRVECL